MQYPQGQHDDLACISRARSRQSGHRGSAPPWHGSSPPLRHACRMVPAAPDARTSCEVAGHSNRVSACEGLCFRETGFRGLGSTRCSDFLRRNRDSNRVSSPRVLRFRETGFRGQRKMRRKRPADCNELSLRTNRRHRCPPIRALSFTFRKFPVARDCVVVDALQIEPVSNSNSLLTGKLTGNFVDSGPLGRFFAPNRQANSAACR